MELCVIRLHCQRFGDPYRRLYSELTTHWPEEEIQRVENSACIYIVPSPQTRIGLVILCCLKKHVV